MHRKPLISLIRDYTTINYRKWLLLRSSWDLICFLGTFTGNSLARVNWKSMAEAPDRFFSPDCMPDNLVFTDPSRMSKDTMDKLLSFWGDRQEQGKVGLQFTGCLPRNFPRGDERRTQGRSLEGDKKKGDDAVAGKGKGITTEKGQSDELDDNAPFSIISSNAQGRIAYLRKFCGDKDYQKIVDVLAQSDEVFISFVRYLLNVLLTA